MKHVERPITRPAEIAALGTSEAALEGCTDLIARMCGRPVGIVRYWLDAYYQLRLAYEAVKAQRKAQEEAGLEAFMATIRRLYDEAAAHEANEAILTPEPAAEPDTKHEEPKVAERSVTPPLPES